MDRSGVEGRLAGNQPGGYWRTGATLWEGSAHFPSPSAAIAAPSAPAPHLHPTGPPDGGGVQRVVGTGGIGSEG